MLLPYAGKILLPYESTTRRTSSSGTLTYEPAAPGTKKRWRDRGTDVANSRYTLED